MEFIGRERELSRLGAELDGAKPSLIIAYGRRRIGKSRLLLEAMKGRTGVYFQAARVSSNLNLDAFKAEVAGALGPSPILDGIATWEGTFHYLADYAANSARGLTVMIDEFPYVTDEDKALPSILQRFWDSNAPARGNLKLVLCGSAIAQMEELLAERNPLYGRKTMALSLKQLPLRDAARFFPRYGAEDRIKAYAVFGGIPYYLQACDPDASLRDNLARLLFQETGTFVDEPTVLLQSELRDPAMYSSVLAAIAGGCTTTSTIADRLRVETKHVGPYLAKLARLDLVLVSRSLDADDKARNLHCAINDPMISFWHEFVRPNLTAIASGHGDDVCAAVVERGFSDYMGKAFEPICLAHVGQHIKEELGSPAQEVGQIWGHADFDIDVAGRLLDGATYFYGECKWRLAPIDLGMVSLLKQRAEKTPYGRNKHCKQFLLFSRSGFKDDVIEAAKVDASLHLIDLERLVFAPHEEPK